MYLIDADATCDVFLKIMNLPKDYVGPSDIMISIDAVFSVLGQVPAVDPVKHGYWIICREFDHKLKCSKCGCHTVWMDEVVPNYCPYCGARMIELKK